MIKNIIFDIGFVLADFRWENYIKELGFSDEICKKVAAATVESPVWNEYDRGVLSEEAIIESCIQQAPDCRDEIKLFFEKIEGIVREYDYSAQWVKDLKSRGFQVYVLSNYPEVPFSYAKKNFEFLKHIDGGIISYEEKCVKPDEEIYLKLLNKYGLKAEESVFLDDRIDNIKAAEQLKFKTIHFTTYKEGLPKLEALL